MKENKKNINNNTSKVLFCIIRNQTPLKDQLFTLNNFVI